ncbi:hypothetical protein DC20_10400 [Rufibacter tibetensis]|uniref:Uncharacterized protein n=1 Tax=Rufibacter tibetensis TaxID=512763 RepID=A0A0P0C3H5_9BACT|nr:hypothetical protein DC20_10400 [Rufibacter tibetensis]
MATDVLFFFCIAINLETNLGKSLQNSGIFNSFQLSFTKSDLKHVKKMEQAASTYQRVKNCLYAA